MKRWQHFHVMTFLRNEAANRILKLNKSNERQQPPSRQDTLAIADKLRGAMDGDNHHDHTSPFLFQRYFSANKEKVKNKEFPQVFHRWAEASPISPNPPFQRSEIFLGYKEMGGYYLDEMD